MQASQRRKVLTVVGTRPEIIRLSRVLARLDECTDHTLVHTGQNYDYELNQIFFEQLRVRTPDHFLGVDTTSLGRILGGVLTGTEQVLAEVRPEAVLILGDTNSALAAIMAKRMRIPVFHMEAGNRCFDANVPEEINRRIVDTVADYNLCYTEHARRHLLSEGKPHRRIYVTGSPMKEVLDHYRADIEASNVLADLELDAERYFLVSVHRQENVDHPDSLRALLECFESLGRDYDMPVVVSCHPRTRQRIDELADRPAMEKVRFLKPFGFFEYNKLQMNALCVLSDSGTITEESSLLGFPAVTIREAIERPEGLDTGSIVLTGLDSNAIRTAIDLVVAQHRAGERPPVPQDYQIDNVSQRVVNLITGLAPLSNRWDGIRS